MQTKQGGALAVIVLALALGGCGTDFDDYGLLSAADGCGEGASEADRVSNKEGKGGGDAAGKASKGAKEKKAKGDKQSLALGDDATDDASSDCQAGAKDKQND